MRLIRDGREPKTVRNVWGTISLIWQAALAQKFVDATLPKPKLPKNIKKKPRFFTLEQVGEIIATSQSEREKCIYWLFAEAGIRSGELAGMLIPNVQLDRITVEQTVWGGEDQSPKTQNAQRAIAISPQLAEMLWRQIGRQSAADSKRLFSVGNGSPLDMNVERRRRLAPLLVTMEFEKAGYHAFRHFNVSLMDALRVPLKTIQERIGHAVTGSFTLDVYGHALDWSANEDAAKRMGEEIAKAVARAEAKVDSGHLTAHQSKTLKLAA